MDKKNKGFTLIELLVTIALMLSLLAIAIISFINLSNKKKEEAYEDVKKQVEQAAEQFFGTNEYYISNLENDNNNSYARISLGKLVKEDYLNSVTNPVTGNKLSYCSYVEVSKENGSYVYTYNDVKDDSKTCNNLNYITVTEPGAPSLTLTSSGTLGNNGWYRSDVTISATVNTENNGKINEVKYCNKKDKNCEPLVNQNIIDSNVYKNVVSDNGELTTVYKVTNVAGKSVTTSISYKIDTVKPTCDVSVNKSVSSTGWFNKSTDKPTITFTSKDATSGLNGASSIKPTIESGEKRYSNTFTDNAGNSNSCSTTIKYDGQAPTCKVNITGKANSERRDTEWYTGGVEITGTCDDTVSGCTGNVLYTHDSETTKITKSPGTVSDKAGNSTECGSKTFGIEKSVKISFNKDETNKSISYNPKGTSNKKPVFNSKYSTCGFGTCSDIKCTTNGSSTCPTDYYAKSCMYVNNYDRVFNATGISVGNNEEVETDGETSSEGMARSETKSRYNCKVKDTYNVFECGNETGSLLNASAHTYQYTSPAGNKSNVIQLYVDYNIDCGYKYN